MTLTVTNPDQVVNNLQTQAIAARSQVLYIMHRKDEDGVSEVDAGGFVAFNVASGAATRYSVNDIVFYFTNTSALKSTVYTITSVADTQIITSATFISVSGGYLNNLTARLNYHIAVNIYTSPGGVLLTNTPLLYVPPQAGLVNVDLSTPMVVLLGGEFSVSPFSLLFTITVEEVWAGSSESPVQQNQEQAVFAKEQIGHLGGALMWENLLLVEAIPLEFPFVNVAGLTPQLEQPWVDQGNNVWEVNEPEDFNPPATSQYLKIIDSPVVIGDVIQVSFDYNLIRDFSAYDIMTMGETGGTAVAIETIQIAAGGSPTSGTLTFNAAVVANYDSVGIGMETLDEFYTLTLSNFSGPITGGRKLLTQFKNPKKWLGWNRTVACLVDPVINQRTGFSDFQVKFSDSDVNKTTALDNSSSPAFTATPTVIIAAVPDPINAAPDDKFVLARVFDDGVTSQLSEGIYYEVECEPDNSICIDWINSKGGVDQWLFSISQTNSRTSGQGVVIERPIIDDIATINRTKQRFAGPTIQVMTLTAEHLTRDQIDALFELKETESLRVYLSKDGTSFIDAIVTSTYETVYETENRRFTFVVQIEFPDDFDFYKAKLY